MMKPFAPNWASKPGNTIWDILNAAKLGVHDLADLLGVSNEEAQRVIDSEMPITQELAERLSKAFGPSVQFWLNRQAQYEESLKRIGTNNEG